MDKKFTTIELFAGAGGLALGLERANFEPLGLIDEIQSPELERHKRRHCQHFAAQP